MTLDLSYSIFAKIFIQTKTIQFIRKSFLFEHTFEKSIHYKQEPLKTNLL